MDNLTPRQAEKYHYQYPTQSEIIALGYSYRQAKNIISLYETFGGDPWVVWLNLHKNAPDGGMA